MVNLNNLHDSDEPRGGMGTGTRREMSHEERELHSLVCTANNLHRAGQPDYNGAKATETMRNAAWQRWLDLAGGDPVKAKRLWQEAMIRGRVKGKKKRGGA